MGLIPYQPSQTDTVLDHILEHGAITSIEAFELYKITRLSAVIYILRHRDKINILDTRESVNIDGKNKKFSRYFLGPTIKNT